MSASQRQEFCVRWNSHLGSIGAAFPQLLAGQRFVDVTLACEGHQVHCHRLVLAACSSYFESILAENPCKHPVIILPSEIKLWEIQALVDFMYKGEVNVTQAGLPQLLRCAEQLRIRGLYGSDAALNLNQLKALTSKAAAAAAAAAAANAMNAGGGGSGGGGSAINDNSMETDDTNSTTTTTATAASALQQLQAGSMAAAMAAQQHQQLHHLKKELPALQQQQQQQHHHHHHQQQSNGTIAQNVLQQNHNLQQQQLHLPQIKQEVTGLTHVVNAAAAIAAAAATSNAATEEDDESADDSTSNAYDRYEQYAATQQSAAAGNNVAAATANAAANAAAIAAAHAHLDSTVEDDHNYVAHDEDSSYGPNADTEHETSANSSSATLLQGAVDAAGSYKRVRRSEASLAQAAKCVSKGQTFQTVSNMFNIPVSTIRFYMARKGILPRRKRGRGASSANSGGAAGAMNAVSAAAMSQALAQMKRSGSPPLAEALYHHQLMSGGGAAGGGAAGASYKLNEQGAAHLI